jgi:2-amino-4-hydroxy-6-hydroxymethyldihydropteridine diphosphokinase
MSEVAFVALGSNLGDRLANFGRALAALEAVPGVTALSEGPLLETEALLPPGDPTPQPKYLNSVVRLETTLTPRQLFDALKAVERELGRTPAPKWSPRIIDLDLLLFGDRVVHEPGLDVPHPALHTRRFVLEPLAALAPEVRHPVLGKTALELLAALPA